MHRINLVLQSVMKGQNITCKYKRDGLSKRVKQLELRGGALSSSCAHEDRLEVTL